MENKEEGFSYTYSSAQRAEIESIRKKYLPQEEDKMQQLRRLDRKVTGKAQAFSIAAGVIGTLIMGLGMSLAMSDLGAPLGSAAMPVGIIVGLVGTAVLSVAYPLYHRILKKERERVAPEILRLTDELMK